MRVVRKRRSAVALRRRGDGMIVVVVMGFGVRFVEPVFFGWCRWSVWLIDGLVVKELVDGWLKGWAAVERVDVDLLEYRGKKR